MKIATVSAVQKLKINIKYIEPTITSRENAIILLTGYWPPTNEMIRHFSQNQNLNSEGWQGENQQEEGEIGTAHLSMPPATPVATLTQIRAQYILAAVLRSGGFSRKELDAKEKEELYKLRAAALKRMLAAHSFGPFESWQQWLPASCNA